MNIEAARADQESAGADFGLKNAPQLLIEGVTRTFPGARGKPPTQALLPIDFAVRENDFVTILGPSGCGKSTLLRIVAWLDFPTSGQVLLDGARITGPGADRGVVFQSYTLFPWLTVEQNIRFGLRERGVSEAVQKERSDFFIAKVGLRGFEQHYPKQLSGGMQQRTAIARALANDPKMLLLDEPFGALDALTRGTIQDELMSIVQDTHQTVFMITHDVDEAILLADRILLMSNGAETPAGYVPGGIAEVMQNPLPRARKRADLHHLPGYYELRNHIVDFLVQRARAGH